MVMIRVELASDSTFERYVLTEPSMLPDFMHDLAREFNSQSLAIWGADADDDELDANYKIMVYDSCIN